MAKLIDIANKNEINLPEKESAVIGRLVGADVQISRFEVSREHAIISHDGGNYWIKDAGSKNGTYLDGKGLSPRQEVILTNGVIISFGTSEKERGYEFRKE